MGLDFAGLESVLESTFAKKPQVVQTNVEAAKAGYDYAAAHFEPLSEQLKKRVKSGPYDMGNELFAMGAAFAGCKFYCAYPMSPATHILEWFAGHGKELWHLRPAGRGRDLCDQHDDRGEPHGSAEHVRHFGRRFRA